MAALTTDATVKGRGLKFNVRSYRLERVIDFSDVSLSATTNYEVGDLPAGFVPRCAAVVEAVKAGASGTLGVYLKSDSTKLVERTLGAAAGHTAAAVSGKHLTGEAEAVCVALGAAQATGKVKVVLAGDLMTGAWDDGLADDPSDPAAHVKGNKM